MYRNNFIVFLASPLVGQVFFVCPAILEGFWREYVDNLPNNTKTDVLMKWIETVPENLRKKIQKFNGEFMPIDSYSSGVLDESVEISTGLLQPKQPPFNPYIMAKVLSESMRANKKLMSKLKSMPKKSKW